MKKCVLSALASILVVSASAQWLPQNAGFTNDTLGFYEMSLPNDSTVWAICYDGKGGLSSPRLILDFTRTTNGGQNWVVGKVGTDTTLGFSNISAVSNNEAWVAMHKRSGTGGGLYHTTDGGITWSQSGAGVIFDANSFPDFVHFRDKDHGVAMGDPNGGSFEIYTTDNGGISWQRVPQQNMPATLTNEYGWISGFYAVGNMIWFGTTSGRIWRSVNFGKDWTAHVADPGGKFINEIAFNDDGLHGVAHLRNNQGATFLYATSDGGITWTAVGQPAYWKRSRITAVPGTNALVSTAVIASDRGSALSYDNGATWTTIDNTILMAVSRFYNASTGYAGSFFITGPPFNPGIYKSQITFQLPVSIPGMQAAENLVKVYPTSANDVINISFAEDQANITSMISVLSLDAKVLESKKSTGAKLVQLNVDRLPPGMYMIRVSSNDKTVSQAITISR